MTFRRDRWAVAVPIIALAIAVGCSKVPSDNQATQQIQAKLSQDSGLQGKALTVQTSAGVVTLSGRVDTEAQRAAAARYAAATPGIKEVVNNLVVGGSEATPAPPQTAAVTPPKAQQVKPPPGVPRGEEKHTSSGRDPSEWDTAASDMSNSGNSQRQPANEIASADSGNANAASAAPPEPATPPPPAPKLMTIPSGTTIPVRLVDSINSETTHAGETFRATLDSPLSANGEAAIPTGYAVEGHVVDVKSAGKFAGQSLLVLQLDRLSVGAKSYGLQTDQFRRQGSNRSTNTAEKVGGGAAIGAILGGIFGGGKGAGIGAAAGGGLGGGVQAAGKGQQIKLASETVLTFTLQAPLTVTKVEKSPDAGRPRLDNR